MKIVMGGWFDWTLAIGSVAMLAVSIVYYYKGRNQ